LYFTEGKKEEEEGRRKNITEKHGKKEKRT